MCPNVYRVSYYISEALCHNHQFNANNLPTIIDASNAHHNAPSEKKIICNRASIQTTFEQCWCVVRV